MKSTRFAGSSFPYLATYFTLYAVLALAIGYLDYETGFAPDLTILYLVPIVLAALHLGFRAAVGVAGVAVLADLASLAEAYKHETRFDAGLGGFLHFVIFLATAYVAWRMRRDYVEIADLRNILTEDLEIAEATQRSILPSHPPAVPGFGVGAKMTFMGAVGGDMYDISTLDGQRQGFFVADISGKSVAAALFTALLRDNWRMSTRSARDAGNIVKDLNQRLFEQLPSDMFVTLFCGILDTQTGELGFVNAGHEPGILFSEDKSTRFLTTPRQMILGVSEVTDVAPQIISMPPGSILFLYTDGLVEPPSAGFSAENIVRVISATAGQTAQEIADAVYAERFAGGSPRKDDVTVLCLKRDQVRSF